MTDDISKVIAEMRALAKTWESFGTYRGSPISDLRDLANRMESATTPAEVGEYTHAQRESMIAAMRRDAAEYCLFGLDYLSSAAHDYATLARQLAEAREVHEAFAGDAARRLNEMESSLAAATRRLGVVEGLVGKWRQRSKIEASAAREFDDPDEMAWHEGKAAQLDESADELEDALTKEPTK